MIGRKKDVIKYKAIQVAPLQLEEFVSNKFSVLEVAVVGVPAEGDLGQLPAAVVVLPPNSTVTETDISMAIEGIHNLKINLTRSFYFLF